MIFSVTLILNQSPERECDYLVDAKTKSTQIRIFQIYLNGIMAVDEVLIFLSWCWSKRSNCQRRKLSILFLAQKKTFTLILHAAPLSPSNNADTAMSPDRPTFWSELNAPNIDWLHHGCFWLKFAPLKWIFSISLSPNITHFEFGLGRNFFA